MRKLTKMILKIIIFFYGIVLPFVFYFKWGFEIKTVLISCLSLTSSMIAGFISGGVHYD